MFQFCILTAAADLISSQALPAIVPPGAGPNSAVPVIGTISPTLGTTKWSLANHYSLAFASSNAVFSAALCSYVSLVGFSFSLLVCNFFKYPLGKKTGALFTYMN